MSSVPSATASTPAAESPPPVRRGLFGPRGPVTPEQQTRIAKSRVRILGFSMVALAALMLVQIVPGLVAYESLVEGNLQNAPGGTLIVQATPMDDQWTITLQEYGSGKAFNSSATDASGRAVFSELTHAVLTVSAVRNGTATNVTGGLYVPMGDNQTLNLSPETAATKWLNGKPVLPDVVALYFGVLAASFVLALAGGIAAIMRKWRGLAMAGAAAFALAGLALILLSGGLGFFQIAIVGLGVWAFFTIRKNPQAFEPPKPALTL